MVGRFLYNIIRACIYYYSRLGTAMAQHGIRAELNIMMRRNPYFFVALFGDSTSPGLILKTMSSWRHVLRSWYWQVHLCGRSNFKSRYLGPRDKAPIYRYIPAAGTYTCFPRSSRFPFSKGTIFFLRSSCMCRVGSNWFYRRSRLLNQLGPRGPGLLIEGQGESGRCPAKTVFQCNYRGILKSFLHHSQSGVPNPTAVVHFPLSENGWFQ